MSTIEPAKIRTREDLVEFIKVLAQDLRQHPDQWENADLPTYLEAMSAWVADMEGFYTNKGESPPARPDWKTLGEILAAARVYE